MSHVFRVSDDAYHAIVAAAARHGQTADELFQAWIEQLQRQFGQGTEEHDPEQAWYWTHEWQEGERRADDDLAAGRLQRFETPEEFFRSLGADEDFVQSIRDIEVGKPLPDDDDADLR